MAQTDRGSWLERLSNRIFAIPSVAQWWARWRAGRMPAVIDPATGIPFARLAKPLAQCRAALITTGGVHRVDQRPFDMENPDGDATYREIPGDVALAELTITHKYYDHRDADQDINVIFPLEHFRDLAAQGVIGQVAPRHFGFMGHIDGELIQVLTRRTAPEVAQKLRQDEVDFALLTPA
ncbi:glycine/betaine/sarcosine/D-proline family reductase selenoprotein B [Litorilinea aerophila]|uniref:Selenoprotein B glycine/betaine/sarcosine/D-proline reductase n=1 Tax=Litorilinea aerophila TaxID=1204385 RepID=A0A540VFY6_9CHLR|nr:glycine/sarcosine/betaine reductase selenoprotein B family protein [Litorilinea aerophila]MCC9076679.1 glycine/betaine/sarcosine/D-proline family reductase selenoprotein B [Litorilinea aerophila]OUC06739.1 hypothetical protein RY27_19170 [Litorilinea aerophila]